MNSPVFEEENKNKNTGKIIPLYPLTYNLSQNVIRQIIENGLRELNDGLDETLPQYLTEEYNLDDINKEMVESLKQLEPFGEGNKMPIFAIKNLKIDSIRALSEGKHLKLTLKDDNLLINAIGFNLGYLSEEYLIGDKIDIAGNLEINKYGRRRDNPNKYKRCYEINIEKGNLYAKQRKCNNR